MEEVYFHPFHSLRRETGTSSEHPLQPRAGSTSVLSSSLVPRQGTGILPVADGSSGIFFLQSENSLYFSSRRQGYIFDKDHSNSGHRAASQFSCVQAGSPATCLKICGNHSFPAFLGLWSNPWGSLCCTLSSAVFCPSICFLLIQLYWLSWLKQHTCP